MNLLIQTRSKVRIYKTMIETAQKKDVSKRNSTENLAILNYKIILKRLETMVEILEHEN